MTRTHAGTIPLHARHILLRLGTVIAVALAATLVVPAANAATGCAAGAGNDYQSSTTLDGWTLLSFSKPSATCDLALDTALAGISAFDVLAVGGGGGGGYGNYGGGGGAGRVIVSSSSFTVSAGETLTITVGAGGAGSNTAGPDSGWLPGTSGGASTVVVTTGGGSQTYEASGGGGGGGGQVDNAEGKTGGSGGGGSGGAGTLGSGPTSGGAVDSSTVTGFDASANVGGDGVGYPGFSLQGGGGGGAGGAGSAGSAGGGGGAGISVWGLPLAAGGGGYSGGTGGSAGGTTIGGASGSAGTHGTGSGGGAGAAGGNGLVVIRYRTPAATGAIVTAGTTTCSQVNAGTATAIPSLSATVARKGTRTYISGVSVGAVYYWAPITMPGESGSGTVFTQTADRAFPLLTPLGSNLVYDTNCVQQKKPKISVASNGSTATISGATAGSSYLVAIKLGTGGLTGQAVPAPSPWTVTWTYAKGLAASDTSLALSPKA